MSLDSEKIPDIIISKIKCKGCSKIFRSNTILKHLRKSTVKNCIDYYNDESLASIKNNSIQLSKTKAEIWKNAHKVEIKQRKARWYQENLDEISVKQLRYNEKDEVQAKRSNRDKERYQAKKAKNLSKSNAKLAEKNDDKISTKSIEPQVINEDIKGSPVIPNDVLCKGCKFIYETNSILKHLAKKTNRECKKKYSKKQLNYLKKNSNNITKEKALLRTKAQEKLKYMKNRDKILKNKKEYYKENKERITKYKKEKYAKDREEILKAKEAAILGDVPSDDILCP